MLYSFVKLEEGIVQAGRFGGWSNFAGVVWNSFGATIGESVYRYTTSNGAWALR